MGTVLVLRTCNADMTSRGGFQWPESGPVESQDWEPTYECGHGLHGLLWGEGECGYLNWSEDARWLVVEVDDADLLHGAGDLTDKCKFRRGVVIALPKTREAATRYIAEHGGVGRAIVGISLTGGYRSTLTGGCRSTLTGGYGSTLTGGYRSTLTGGNRSTLTGGYESTLTGGYRSTLIGGYRSTLTGGYGSTLTGGDESTLTGGYESTLTGGYGSTLTGGDESTLTGVWYDGTRHRIAVGYVGEDGIEPNVAYRVEPGKFVRVEATP